MLSQGAATLRPLAGAICFALLLGTAVPPGAGQLGPQATLPLSDYALAVAPQKYIRVDDPVARLYDVSAYEQMAEPMFDAAGNLLLAYVNETRPYFARFQGTTIALATSPVQMTARTNSEMWDSTNANPRGAYSALDSQGRLVRVYWGAPGQTVYYQVYNLSGALIRGETLVGNASGGTSTTPVVAVGSNDTLHIVRSTASGPGVARLLYDKILGNGTPELRNITLYNDGGNNFYPHVYFDAPRARVIVSWVNGAGVGRVLAIDESAQTLWAPVSLGSTGGAPPSLAVLPDGGVVAAWATGAAVRAARLASDGTVAVAATNLLTGLNTAQGARPYITPLGDLAVVYREIAGGSDTEVRVAAFDNQTFAQIVAPAFLSSDDLPSGQQRAALAPDGAIVVAWSNVSGNFITDGDVWTTSASERISGFSAHAPAQYWSMVRGDRLTVPFNVTSDASPTTSYRFAPSASNFRGPTNWSMAVVDALGAPVTNLTLAAGTRADLSIAVDAPVADPAGYGAFLNVYIEDQARPEVNATLTFNVTVLQGHRLTVTPSDVNATVAPGAATDFAFTFRNNGTVGESGLPILLTAGAPPGWTGALSRTSFDAAPNGAVDVTLSVAVPSNATSTEKYCARLRVQSPNDSFAIATAGFCVLVSLVATPWVTPEAAAVTVTPASAVQAAFTVGQDGNAGAPILCHLALQTSLPSGWSTTGNPADFNLARGASVNVTIVLGAPSNAAGGTRLDLTFAATCEGTSAADTSQLAVTVADVHSVAWMAPGSSADANATGAARLNISVENQGNVGEAVAIASSDVPPGWTVQGSLTVAGSPAGAVPPFTTGVFSIAVQAPPGTLAGVYRVNFTLAAGGGAGFAASFSVRIPKTYGIAADFSPAVATAQPAERVPVVVQLQHLGNTADTYSVAVGLAGSELWLWEASFAPAPGAYGNYFAGSLSLDPFAAGTLTVNITVPREPSATSYSIAVSVSNVRAAPAAYALALHIALPQLTVAFGAMPSGTAPFSGVLEVVVSNLGDAAAVAPALLVTLDGAQLELEALADLAAGASVQVRVNFTIAGAGAHGVVATVDPTGVPGASPTSGRIFESNESDNGAHGIVQVDAPTAPPPPGNTGPTTTTLAGDSMVWILVILLGVSAAAVAFVLVKRRRREKAS